MITINVTQLTQHTRAVLKITEGGEKVRILKHGKAMAMLQATREGVGCEVTRVITSTELWNSTGAIMRDCFVHRDVIEITRYGTAVAYLLPGSGEKVLSVFCSLLPDKNSE